MLNQIARIISGKYFCFFAASKRERKNDRKIPIVNIVFIAGLSFYLKTSVIIHN